MTRSALSQPEAPAERDSALAPLRRGGFRTVWSGLAGSQLVIWMNTVGAVTVIASVSDSSTLIALVQTANSVPAVLLGLLTGTVADIVDRRRLALGAQLLMLAAVGGLAVLTLTETVTAGAALGLTFALGAGMATTFVIYQALTPDFVPRAELPAAVALNGVAINLARAVGPALAGLLIALLSAGALFAIEAGLMALVMGVVLALRAPARRRASRERLAPAIRAGLRFVRFSWPVRAVLARGALFSVFASALWALLPVVALERLDLGSGGFGLLMGCVGAGAITGAALLPRLRRRLSLDRLLVSATVGVAAGLLALAYVPSVPLVGLAVFLTGGCWLTVLSSLNTSAQRVAPGWVRARTLATFQLVMQGGLALGSLALGLITGAAGVRAALLIGAGGLAAGVLGVRRWPLAHTELADLSPAGTWSDPAAAFEPVPSDGPVLITVEYRIDSSGAEEFVAAMQELGQVRRRDGAYRWNLYEDLEAPGCYLETFVVDSWEEHLRQHARLTVADLEVERRAKSIHRGPEPPVVRHLLWAPAALRAEGRPKPE
jgi:MFS family permease